MKKRTTLLLASFILILTSVWSQTDFRLKIQGAGTVPEANAQEPESWTIDNDDIYDGKVYRILQFHKEIYIRH